MWLEEALRVFTRLTSIKPLLQNQNRSFRRAFPTPVLDNAINLPYLRTTPGTQKQKGQERYPM